MKFKVVWRGWRNCPLLIIGRFTIFLSNGILFGISHNWGDTCYYIGWIIASRKHHCFEDWIEDKKHRPKDWHWVIKYIKPRG